MVAGNHDHGLVAGWIDGRLETEPSGFLGLEQYLEPAEAGPLAAVLAGHAAPARVRVAYPGLWLREDVYAIHGHYADLHATVPTFERLATGAMARWVVRLPEAGAAPDDYEAVLAPLYAWMSALTQRSEHARSFRRRGRLLARLGRARGRRPPPPPGARRRARRRLHRRGRGAQRRRARPARPQPLRRRRCGAATCTASAR